MCTKVKAAVACLTVGILALAGSVEASSIKISDGSTTYTIADGFTDLNPLTPDDLNPMTGAVLFSGMVGAWQVNVTLGVTTPLLGSLSSPSMHLTDFSASCVLAICLSAPSALTVSFSEVNFGSGPVAIAKFGGVAAAGATVTYETWLGVGLFDEGTLLTSLSAGGGQFSGIDYGTVTDPEGPYSLTQKVRIAHPGGLAGFGASTSVDATLTVPDGGMTLSLLGFALVGLGGLQRKLSTRRR